jgi:site-specific DNA recombinase
MGHNMETAIGYVRVSTDEQAEKGVSLDAQESRIRAWASARGLAPDSVPIFRDEGISGGRTENRPGFLAAVDAACASRGSTLVVYHSYRLSRDLADTMALWDRLDRAGVAVVSLTDQIDRSTASGELHGIVNAAFGHYERKVIKERTVAAVNYKRAKGEVLGQVPYGKRLPEGAARNADGTYPPHVVLEDDPAELLALEVLDQLHASGQGPRAIAREMSKRGFPTKSGRPWAESTVRTLTAKRRPNAPRQANPNEVPV